MHLREISPSEHAQKRKHTISHLPPWKPDSRQYKVPYCSVSHTHVPAGSRRTTATLAGTFLRPERFPTVASSLNTYHSKFNYGIPCCAIANSARLLSRIGAVLVTLLRPWRKSPCLSGCSQSRKGNSGSSGKCHATFGGLISSLDAPRTVDSTACASLLHRDTRSSN